MIRLQMKFHRPVRFAFAGIVVAACAAVLAPAASAAPARKPAPPRAHVSQVTPDQVAAAAKLAYQAYSYFAGNQLTLAQATKGSSTPSTRQGNRSWATSTPSPPAMARRAPRAR